MLRAGVGENNTYILLNRRVIEESRKRMGAALREKCCSDARASCFGKPLRTPFVARRCCCTASRRQFIEFDCLFRFFSSMSFQRRALSTAVSPALRARLLSLPASCRTLSIESVQSWGRLSRPINKRTDQTRLYSTANSASVLENFKKSCRIYIPIG